MRVRESSHSWRKTIWLSAVYAQAQIALNCSLSNCSFVFRQCTSTTECRRRNVADDSSFANGPGWRKPSAMIWLQLGLVSRLTFVTESRPKEQNHVPAIVRMRGDRPNPLLILRRGSPQTALLAARCRRSAEAVSASRNSSPTLGLFVANLAAV